MCESELEIEHPQITQREIDRIYMIHKIKRLARSLSFFILSILLILSIFLSLKSV